jgi:DNA-binding CsgD family transcriptional regulator
MASGTRDRHVQDIVRTCGFPGDDLGAFRARLLSSLRKAVPFDAAFFATADPDTLLFSSAFAEEPLGPAAPLFLDNEFGTHCDVNRFTEVAHAAVPVASLDHKTRGDWAASPRWRQVIQPLGLGDEARVALRVDGTTWGFMCLHRSGTIGFAAHELATLAKVAPHAGAALRPLAATVHGDPAATSAPEAVILATRDVVVAVGGAVEQLGWGLIPVGAQLPVPLAMVVHRLEAIESGTATSLAATVRINTPAGGLVAVHATRLHEKSGSGPAVLTLAPISSPERSSLLLAACGLTPAQRRVANLVLQGRTTRQILIELHISAHTVQDHLKAVFDKTGVRSRRELVSALMRMPK